LENYVLMKKTSSFLVIKLDASEKIYSSLETIFGNSEENLAKIGADLDLESIKKIYQITEEETLLRNGLINGILNNIIIKKLR